MARPRPRKSLIDNKFHALIGEVVVSLGQLEDEMRHFVCGHLSPGIEVEIALGLFSRVRFAELLEMYELVVGYAIQKAEGDEKISPEIGKSLRLELKDICKKISKVNERRNAVVHSAYVETEYVEDGKTVGRAILAQKPNKNALDVTEDFSPFQNIDKEIQEVLSDIGAIRDRFVRFDFSILQYVNAFWVSFAARVLEWRQEGLLNSPSLRFQLPSVRLG